MVNNDYRILRNLAISYARSCGVRDLQACEDFGQEYCLAVFEGKHPRFDHRFADFTRGAFGRKNPGKKYGRKFYTNIFYGELPLDDDCRALRMELIDLDQNILHSELRLAVKRLKGKRRQVAELYIQDISQVEIARILGCHPARICQLMIEIVVRLRKIMC